MRYRFFVIGITLVLFITLLGCTSNTPTTTEKPLGTFTYDTAASELQSSKEYFQKSTTDLSTTPDSAAKEAILKINTFELETNAYFISELEKLQAPGDDSARFGLIQAYTFEILTAAIAIINVTKDLNVPDKNIFVYPLSAYSPEFDAQINKLELKSLATQPIMVMIPKDENVMKETKKSVPNNDFSDAFVAESLIKTDDAVRRWIEYTQKKLQTAITQNDSFTILYYGSQLWAMKTAYPAK